MEHPEKYPEPDRSCSRLRRGTSLSSLTREQQLDVLSHLPPLGLIMW